MAVLAGVLVGIGSIATATAARLLADEGRSWLPWLSRSVMGHAVATLPHQYRERMREEWARHLGDVPGEIGKLIVAVGFVMGWLPNQLGFWSV